VATRVGEVQGSPPRFDFCPVDIHFGGGGQETLEFIHSVGASVEDQRFFHQRRRGKKGMFIDYYYS